MVRRLAAMLASYSNECELCMENFALYFLRNMRLPVDVHNQLDHEANLDLGDEKKMTNMITVQLGTSK